MVVAPRDTATAGVPNAICWCEIRSLGRELSRNTAPWLPGLALPLGTAYRGVTSQRRGWLNDVLGGFVSQLGDAYLIICGRESGGVRRRVA